MGRKRTPGLYKRSGVWHVDKTAFGRRVCETTGTSSLEEAEKYLARRLDQIRDAQVFGIRPERTFREGAARYLTENTHKVSLKYDAIHIQQLDAYIGKMPLRMIHTGTLQAFVKDRQKQGRKAKTINLALAVVRRIINLAASEWIDETGLTWLASAPKIRMLPEHDKGKPYPLTFEEQNQLFKELAPHLRRMALFKVNVGLRDTEVCRLRWEWECPIPELNTSVFIIPGWIEHISAKGETRLVKHTKNGEDRLVVLNDIAKEIVEEVRGDHPEFLFIFRGKPIIRINNNGWQHARKKAGLSHVRVHDLKHTFGRRLRAAGVSLEDRQDLLGHKAGKITTHYSTAEVSNLIAAANKVCDQTAGGLTLTMLRTQRRAIKIGSAEPSSRKSPAKVLLFENSSMRRAG